MRHLQTCWQHIRRSPYQALVAILVMTLTFYLASIFALLVSGSQAALNFFETRPQVTAFFKDEVKITQVEDLRQKLKNTEKVAETKYVSKEEALAIYREQNKADPALVEMVTANILPASLEVSATGISYLPEIAQILKNEPGVEEVIFQEDVVASLNNWTTIIRRTGLELVGSLGLASLLIVSVITGMKVVLRREEIEVLQLIGASRWYIRVPFILEGALYGGIGAILGWGFAYLRLLYSAPTLVRFLEDIPVPPVPPITLMLPLLGGEVLLGVAIGTLGSLVAARRYLR